MLTFDNDFASGNNRFIWQQQSQNTLRVCKFRSKMVDQRPLFVVSAMFTIANFSTLLATYVTCVKFGATLNPVCTESLGLSLSKFRLPNCEMTLPNNLTNSTLLS